jgi:hypothetical protein
MRVMTSRKCALFLSLHFFTECQVDLSSNSHTSKHFVKLVTQIDCSLHIKHLSNVSPFIVEEP